MDRCDECRFEYGTEDESSIPDRLRTLGRRYRAPLTRFLPGEDGPALLGRHPAGGGWSALEYACHVRDVLEVQLARLEQTLLEELPEYAPMGREERVAELDYAGADPAEVADAVAANAEALAAAFEALDEEQWDRAGIYGYPERTERPLRWLGQHTVHEAHHHLLDVGRALRTARGR